MHRGDRREISAEQKVSPTSTRITNTLIIIIITVIIAIISTKMIIWGYHFLSKRRAKKIAPKNTSMACMQQTIDTKMHLIPE